MLDCWTDRSAQRACLPHRALGGLRGRVPCTVCHVHAARAAGSGRVASTIDHATAVARTPPSRSWHMHLFSSATANGHPRPRTPPRPRPARLLLLLRLLLSTWAFPSSGEPPPPRRHTLHTRLTSARPPSRRVLTLGHLFQTSDVRRRPPSSSTAAAIQRCQRDGRRRSKSDPPGTRHLAPGTRPVTSLVTQNQTRWRGVRRRPRRGSTAARHALDLARPSINQTPTAVRRTSHARRTCCARRARRQRPTQRNATGTRNRTKEWHMEHGPGPLVFVHDTPSELWERNTRCVPFCRLCLCPAAAVLIAAAHSGCAVQHATAAATDRPSFSSSKRTLSHTPPCNSGSAGYP